MKSALNKEISVSVPGRICLFGEHQDYLKLPVITAAINLRVAIHGHTRADRYVNLDLPDIASKEKFLLPNGESGLTYEKERDYFKSVVNVLRKEGITFNNGCDCSVVGDIPINSGTSSSSALNVAWARYLLSLGIGGQQLLDPHHVARIAYLAEVEEFGEPGGMMDHYATAVGGILYMEFSDPVKIDSIENNLGTFVLGDSLEAKDTKNILHRVKYGVLNAVKVIKQTNSNFDLSIADISELTQYQSLLSDDQFEVLFGAMLNRDITLRAKEIFFEEQTNQQVFGELLNEHQEILDKRLKISTPKINNMLSAAMDAGAYGGKINGSGGGGCMFVYSPERPEKVAEAIKKQGGKPYIVSVDQGMEIHYQ